LPSGLFTLKVFVDSRPEPAVVLLFSLEASGGNELWISLSAKLKKNDFFGVDLMNHFLPEFTDLIF
jgi:hypothetical protein